MEQQRFQKDTILFGAAISACKKAGKLQEAGNMCKQKSKGLMKKRRKTGGRDWWFVEPESVDGHNANSSLWDWQRKIPEEVSFSEEENIEET